MRVSESFELHPGADALLAWIGEHFGVPLAVFAGHRVWRKIPSATLWIAAAGVEPVAGLPYEVVGIRLQRNDASFGQVSNAFVRRFLNGATRHVLDLDGDALERFLVGDPGALEPAPRNGYYVVRAAGEALGRGRVHDGVLHSELPKEERRSARAAAAG
ncbi:MAG: hypothetical protein KC635_01215 [Myxococcales bacterium]|nr:hypothetical protein [Myxococcales bacterium]MCB9733171.1 hypothetical protein [Deltaproteobacteria bacterium]